jgi:hypothetical protein
MGTGWAAGLARRDSYPRTLSHGRYLLTRNGEMNDDGGFVKPVENSLGVFVPLGGKERVAWIYHHDGLSSGDMAGDATSPSPATDLTPGRTRLRPRNDLGRRRRFPTSGLASGSNRPRLCPADYAPGYGRPPARSLAGHPQLLSLGPARALRAAGRRLASPRRACDQRTS